MPLDAWRANEFGDEPYVHAIGFNLNEHARIDRDAAYSMGGQRIPVYPIHAWGWIVAAEWSCPDSPLAATIG